jgi:hypothetical protein
MNAEFRRRRSKFGPAATNISVLCRLVLRKACLIPYSASKFIANPRTNQVERAGRLLYRIRSKFIAGFKSPTRQSMRYGDSA